MRLRIAAAAQQIDDFVGSSRVADRHQMRRREQHRRVGECARFQLRLEQARVLDVVIRPYAEKRRRRDGENQKEGFAPGVQKKTNQKGLAVNLYSNGHKSPSRCRGNTFSLSRFRPGVSVTTLNCLRLSRRVEMEVYRVERQIHPDHVHDIDPNALSAGRNADVA